MTLRKETLRVVRARTAGQDDSHGYARRNFSLCLLQSSLGCSGACDVSHDHIGTVIARRMKAIATRLSDFTPKRTIKPTVYDPGNARVPTPPMVLVEPHRSTAALEGPRFVQNRRGYGVVEGAAEAGDQGKDHQPEIE